MTPEGLELSAIAQDVGEAHESVEAKYEGSELTVAFNSQFLLDGLDAAASDEVVLESIDPLKPAVLKATGQSRLPLPVDARPHLLTGTPPMHLAGLWLTDFRCYREAELRPRAGVTVISGANAQGKTSLLEAVAWAATGSSFRGVPDAALVRTGCDAAILRAEVVDGERVQLLEAEIRAAGRNRVQVNRQALQRAQDRAEFVRVTVFAPDDLQLVKGGPAGRRDYLDDLLVAAAPRYAAVRGDYERVLRQRNASAAARRAQPRRRAHAGGVRHPARPRGGRARAGTAPDARTPRPARRRRLPGARGNADRRRRRLRVGWLADADGGAGVGAAGRAPGTPAGRARPAGHAGRPAPRRVAAARRRARQPLARVAG